MYSDLILYYYRFPENKGKLEDNDSEYNIDNPFCGDSISMYLKIRKDRIKSIKFDGHGCAISIATASLLTSYAINKKIEDIKKLDSTFIQKLINVQLNPTRLKCALLPLEVLQKAILVYDK